VALSGGDGKLLPAINCRGVSILGFVTFSGLYVDGVPGNYSLNFNSSGVGNASQSINIYPSASKTHPANIVLAPKASSPSAVGVPFTTQPRIRFVNSAGGTDPVNDYPVTVALSSSGTGTGVLLPVANCRVTSVSGFANFSALYIAGDPGNYVLNFNAADVGNCSQAMIVTGTKREENKHDHEKPVKLELAIPVSSPSRVGTQFDTQPRLQFVDAQGQTVSVSGYTVTASLTGKAGNVAALLPTQNCVGVSVVGFVYFTELFAVGTPGDYMLNFYCADINKSATQAITLLGDTPLLPSGIAFVNLATSPSTLGVPFATQPRIRFVNASGGTDPVNGDVVTVALSNNGGLNGTLQGTTSGVSHAGVVTFSGLYINGDAGDYFLNFNSTGVGNCSQPITVTA